MRMQCKKILLTAISCLYLLASQGQHDNQTYLGKGKFLLQMYGTAGKPEGKIC